MNMNRFTDREVDEVARALDVSFTSADREALLQGRYTSLIDELSDGQSQRPGKIRLEKDVRTKEIRVNFYFRKEALFIPDVLFGRRLSVEEKLRMRDGELLRFSYKGRGIYLQVDRELNSVIVKSDRDLNIPAVIGNYNDFPGYSLTEEDKRILADGGILPPKVLKGEQGFFLARFSMTDDMKGYSFRDYETIPDREVAGYLEKYNSVNLSAEVVEKPSVEVKSAELGETLLEGKAERDFDRELCHALDRRDFEKLNELAKSGYRPAEQQISKIESLPGITDADKIAIRTIFGIEAKESVESRIVRKEVTKGNVVLNEKGAEKRGHDGRKEKIGNVVCQVFRE